MKHLLSVCALLATPAFGQLWTEHVSDGVSMLPIMSCGSYDWNNGGRVIKEPDCLMIHVKPSVPVARMLVTVHVKPFADGTPWVYRWTNATHPWTVVAFQNMRDREIYVIDVEGFDGNGHSVWWVTYPFRS